jgi:hypothetical protein
MRSAYQYEEVMELPHEKAVRAREEVFQQASKFLDAVVFDNNFFLLDAEGGVGAFTKV